MTTIGIPAQPAAGRPPVPTGPQLRLGAGVRVIQRDRRRLQIGTDAPRRVIVQNPPPAAAEVLSGLDGNEPAGQVMDRVGSHPQLWGDLLVQLVDAGLLGRSGTGPVADRLLGHEAERAHLTHRYGTHQADVLLGRRADAMVEIRGTGPVACAMALQLAASGIGHVYHAPDRQLRPHDLLPPDASPGGVDDRARLAARLRAVSERIQVHPVAGHQRAGFIVLAGDGPADAAAARALVAEDVPHLAVSAGAARAVVGPLVLPGISSCLWCAELTRTDADPGWPLVRQAMLDRPQPPPAVLAAGAAAIATAEVLDLVQGVQQPSTVDGTVEWGAAGLPRRRSWPRRPDCGCGANHG
ncbi:hypothetical protein [Nakamurella lactea]|uniref:hypothetical protein n=1 Tax=Nakamurella lactea TaxID=459515 RepID=UPI0004020B09|nr:hypothetical protein [Nakamurella lactea]